LCIVEDKKREIFALPIGANGVAVELKRRGFVGGKR
jgi:hypothetical protein